MEIREMDTFQNNRIREVFFKFIFSADFFEMLYFICN